MIVNMMYWIFVEIIVLFIFRYVVVLVAGHDLFDTENTYNKVLYVVIIAASFIWLREKFSVDGVSKLGRNYDG